MKGIKGIYKLNVSVGRQGHLEGVLIATAKQVEILVKTGIVVYFGEVLGKHSNVALSIKESMITLVTQDTKVIELFETFDLESGYNPFDYPNYFFEPSDLGLEMEYFQDLLEDCLEDWNIKDIIDILIEKGYEWMN